jgi:hypothetical protein
MSEETVQKNLGPKKRLSKKAAISVMVLGGLMILISWFLFPAEPDSTLQLVKIIVGAVGFVVLIVGAHFRP